MEPNSLTSQFIKDWSWANCQPLELWERKAIRRIDLKWKESQ